MGETGLLQNYCRRICTKYYSVKPLNTTTFPKIRTEFFKGLHFGATSSDSINARNVRE
jgi:hypothetical protein